MSGAGEPASGGSVVAVGRAYAWYVLVLLTAINLVNYVDRFVPTGMLGDLRGKLHLSDGEIGALWWAFFTVHALTTVPFGWAADRWDRRRIIAFGVIAWSLATLGAAFATGFVGLLLCRGAIGIGEAAYGPTANALLCEIFPPEHKARTVAIFNVGMFAGASAGGIVGVLLGFPNAFVVVALPGIALGVLAWMMRVPAVRIDRAVAPRISVGSMYAEAWRALQVPTLRRMLVAGVLISFAAGGYANWFLDFSTRVKGFDPRDAAVLMGVLLLTVGPGGVVAGGLLADRLQRTRAHGRVLAIAVGFFLAVPFALLAIFLPHGIAWYGAAALLLFFIPFYNGPMAAVIDDVTDPERAATAQASFIFLLHLVGTAPGGLCVGLLSSRIGLQYALLAPTAATLLAGVACLAATRVVGADMTARERRALDRAGTAA